MANQGPAEYTLASQKDHSVIGGGFGALLVAYARSDHLSEPFSSFVLYTAPFSPLITKRMSLMCSYAATFLNNSFGKRLFQQKQKDILKAIDDPNTTEEQKNRLTQILEEDQNQNFTLNYQSPLNSDSRVKSTFKNGIPTIKFAKKGAKDSLLARQKAISVKKSGNAKKTSRSNS